VRHVHRSSLDFAFTPEHFRQEGPRLLCAVLNSIFPDKPVLLNLGLGSEQRGEDGTRELPLHGDDLFGFLCP